jgi:ABC-type spermidine/putrescine transport system permease subunit II
MTKRTLSSNRIPYLADSCQCIENDSFISYTRCCCKSGQVGTSPPPDLTQPPKPSAYSGRKICVVPKFCAWSIFGYPTQLNEQTLYVESTDQLLAAVRNSLIVAASTTTISTILGTMTALALFRYRFRVRGIYQGLLYMPMVMPDIVLGIALLVIFVSCGLTLGRLSIIVGHCTFLISYVFVVVSARLAGMDDTLEQASADLGANPWVTFRRVTLPQILPGVIGGALLAFIISMDEVVPARPRAGLPWTAKDFMSVRWSRRTTAPGHGSRCSAGASVRR